MPPRTPLIIVDRIAYFNHFLFFLLINDRIIDTLRWGAVALFSVNLTVISQTDHNLTNLYCGVYFMCCERKKAVV